MKICVYGAASNDIRESYIEKTEKLGVLLAQSGHSLVFGGGASGLMGAAARGFHRGGAEIVGVAPSFFNVDGVLFPHCTQMIYTETMRERKETMENLSDGFVVTPGGIGTLEEFFEILTLKQLGRHNKPIAVFNAEGYYTPMLDMMRHVAKEGFMREINLGLLRECATAGEVLSYLETYSDPAPNLHLYRGGR